MCLDIGVRAMTVAAGLACVLVGTPLGTLFAAETPAPSATTRSTDTSAPSATTPTATLPQGSAPAGSTPEESKPENPKPDACSLLPRIDSGDLSGLEPLTAQKDPAFGAAMTDYLSCLAIAKGDRGYCELLPKAERAACALRSQTVEKLKTPTNDKKVAGTIAPLLDQECRRQTTKAECDQLQKAIATSDAGKCKGLRYLADACRALVAGDPKPCGEDARCRELIENLATLQETGVSGLKGSSSPSLLDSLLAAAQDGESACAPLREALRPTCGEVTK